VEIEALLDAFKRARAMLLPQNPSRGRTIGGGVYRIDGVPLDQTSFKDDPDHPAGSSLAADLLGSGSARITIADASNLDEVRQCASSLPANILPAGGADFFQAVLEQHGLRPTRPMITSLAANRSLFVCGSASSQCKLLIARFRQQCLPVCAMPEDVFQGASPGAWAATIAQSLQQSGNALVVIDRPLDRSPGASARLQQSLAEVVVNVLAQQAVDTLLLEGGATASAVCRRMGWNEFDVSGELATGAAVMLARGTTPQRIAVKPGSYAWPDATWT
jgi:uncharacterized protein YgbK (DUF1537 family)